MGLYKLCKHRGRERDRCAHVWWATFRDKRVSLPKWTNRSIANKTQAQAALEEFRQAVRQGRFDPAGLHAVALPDGQPTTTTSLTLRRLAEIYVERHVRARGLKVAATISYRLKPIVDYFGDWLISHVRTADIEDFIAFLREPRQTRGGTARRLAPASINRTVTLLRHMFNWAVGRDYLERTPFRRGSEVLIRLEKEDNRRRRRIGEDEERRLLAFAPALLRSKIIAALDTGMRRGEMLSIRVGDIDAVKWEILLRGSTTKDGETRRVPVATIRLRAVLGWLLMDADGERKPNDAFLFGEEVAGELPGSFRRAWVTTVLRAHGVKPTWQKHSGSGRRKKGWKELTPECHEAFRKIDLHWHDLRHEFASRLVERGVPLAQVRDLLGHASITTTERYDNQRWEALCAAAAQLEAGKTFRLDGDGRAGSESQDSLKIGSPAIDGDGRESDSTTDVNGCEEKDLEDLAGRQGFEPR